MALDLTRNLNAALSYLQGPKYGDERRVEALEEYAAMAGIS